ncbi:hypothetical protein [Paraurantiacibacter namhicola]|uniref:C-type lysozyme inhibitor domain-containing protein n=1 Tax=Paraurantiacibacter namhicola TaxID=645517 RepID=A0A1C7D6K0_9SPHN|nr:hypothetical protein [Paraurantiacibacter namhicola]ANU07116.1 hypothetical protein A6F65_00797 [Paraurantiacibacter namhicola]
MTNLVNPMRALCLPAALAAICIYAPAQASFDDQLVCASDAHDSLIVILSSTDSERADVQAIRMGESGTARLTKVASSDDGPFTHYADGDIRFVMGGGYGILSMRDAYYQCTLVGEPEEEEAGMDLPLTGGVPRIVATGDGLTILEQGKPDNLIPFGLSQPDMVSILSRYLGDPGPVERMEECSSGSMEFIAFGPLQLSFSGGAWTGWWMLEDGRDADDAAQVTTRFGTAVGDPLPEPAMDVIQTMGTTQDQMFTIEGVTYIRDEGDDNTNVFRILAGQNCTAM